MPQRYDREALTELIQQVVQEELQKCHTAAPPSVTAVTDLIQDEIRQTILLSPQSGAEAPTLSYTDVLQASTLLMARFLHPLAETSQRSPSPIHRPALQTGYRLNPRKSTV